MRSVFHPCSLQRILRVGQQAPVLGDEFQSGPEFSSPPLWSAQEVAEFHQKHSGTIQLLEALVEARNKTSTRSNYSQDVSLRQHFEPHVPQSKKLGKQVIESNWDWVNGLWMAMVYKPPDLVHQAVKSLCDR